MFLIQFLFLVLPTTGKANNISHVSVSLVNPWSAPLRINKVSSTVTSFGLSLGTIESTTGFTVSAKSTTQSPTLDLNMNFEPAVLFTIARALAVEAGLNVDPLDGIVQLGGISYLTIAGPTMEERQNADLYKFVSRKLSRMYLTPSNRGFNLPTFKKLHSNVQLDAGVTIGKLDHDHEFKHHVTLFRQATTKQLCNTRNQVYL